jgi:Tol biopolymer transport system component
VTQRRLAQLGATLSGSAHDFWRSALLVVVANFLIIGVVLARGDQRDAVPSRVVPASDAANVSTRPTIRVTYPGTLDPGTATSPIVMSPSVDGEISATGSELSFLPARPLQPATTYIVTVRAGLREVNGTVARSDRSYRFKTRPPRLVVTRPNADGRLKGAWALDATTGKSWPISPEGMALTGLTASPDGDSHAYVQQVAPDRWMLWSAPVDGGAPKKIVPETNGFTANVAWSPRGDLLAYENSAIQRSQVGNPRLWLVRSDGTQSSLLYGRGDESGSDPVWAPDGRQLIFYENRFSTISLFNFTKTLLSVPSDVRAPVSWSPDGKAFTFTTRTGDTGARTVVKVARLSGGHLDVSTITDGQTNELRPSWSPDGAWIAFERLASDGRVRIWLVRPDGNEAHAIQEETGWIYSPPSWSPDGSAIAFGRFRVGSAAARSASEIWVAPLATPLRQLNSTGDVVAWIP